jgi:DNA-binding winged helix-turn-helix (wHTH) protein
MISPDTLTNKLMRNLDFFEEGEGMALERFITVTWKDEEKVDPKRITQTIANIKSALEKTGYDCFSVEPVGEIGRTISEPAIKEKVSYRKKVREK